MARKLTPAAAAVVLALASVVAQSQTLPQGVRQWPRWAHQRIRLPNGLRVLLHSMRPQPKITVNVDVSGRITTRRLGETGMAHTPSST